MSAMERKCLPFYRRHPLREPSFYAWRRVLRERGLIDTFPSANACQQLPTTSSCRWPSTPALRRYPLNASVEVRKQ